MRQTPSPVPTLVLPALLAALLLCRCTCLEPVEEGSADADADPAVDAGGDAGPGAADATPRAPDAGHAPDAAASTCAAADPWRYEARDIASLVLFEGRAHLGATERLLVTLRSAGGCERPGRVDLAVTNGLGTDALELAAHAWVRDGACDPVPMTVLVQVPGRTQAASSVRAMAVGPQAVSLSYDRACIDLNACRCEPTQGPGLAVAGAACATDCDCAYGLACVAGHDASAKAAYSCQAPCWDGTECSGSQTCAGPSPWATSYVCLAAACEVAADCPAGFGCEQKVCVEERQAAMGRACLCDDDCAPGSWCTSLPALATPTCQIRCAADGWQCPYHQAVYLCGTPAVCVPPD